MPKIAYTTACFRTVTLELIDRCNEIIADLRQDGMTPTLRQLYYALVTRNIIRNNIKEYNRLGNTVNDARLAGFIDWDAIQDRTRNLATIGHWNNPADIINACAASFRIDKWANQDVRIEVWIEKEALAGVFETICEKLDVPYLSCRGYTSQSEMWAASQRYVQYIKQGKYVQILHFGDHDPSGIDMTRDIEARLRMFVSHHTSPIMSDRLDIKRIALNMDQIEQYKPPENPAKSTDTRFVDYQSKFGDSSWELDALNPRVLRALVTDEILLLRNERRWNQMQAVENSHRATLGTMSIHWSELNGHIADKYAATVKEQIKFEGKQNKL